MLKPPKLKISSAKDFSSPSGADATTFIYDKNLKKTIQYSFCLSEYKCPIGLGDLNGCFGQRFDSAQLHYLGL